MLPQKVNKKQLFKSSVCEREKERITRLYFTTKKLCNCVETIMSHLEKLTEAEGLSIGLSLPIYTTSKASSMVPVKFYCSVTSQV